MRNANLMIFAATAALLSTGAVAAPARQFLADALKGDNSEMMLGRFAASRAESAGIRDYGARLRSDHGHARVDAARVARALHVPVTTVVMPEAARERARLARLRGEAFDREFVRYMIHDHREDIATFAEQARNGDRRTAALARAQLPTLREHLRIAESLAR